MKIVLSTSTLAAMALFSAAGWADTRPSTLSFEQRVEAQRAIELVYYSHQLDAARPFEEAVPRELLERKVRTYLRQSDALVRFWDTPVTSAMLQREAERMARGTQMPERLSELHTALGNDPFLILECLVRPSLVSRLSRNFHDFDATIHGEARREAQTVHDRLVAGEIDASEEEPRRTVVEMRPGFDEPDTVPQSPAVGKGNEDPGDGILRLSLPPERFNRMAESLPRRPGEIGSVQEERDAFRVWVTLARETDRIRAIVYSIPKRSWDDWWASVEDDLSEEDVITVAGEDAYVPAPVGSGSTFQHELGGPPNSLCPGNDTWDNGSLDDIPTARRDHSAVWTGSLMIIWGGRFGTNNLDTGGRYDPATDTWTPTSTTNAPLGRYKHTAVWTGSLMVVWGGLSGTYLATGGRYDPSNDTWSPTSTTNAPLGRAYHTATWTGSLMVVWGGRGASQWYDTGGRYNPSNDTWSPTSTTNAPWPRQEHTAVWTGSLMIVWGGVGTGLVAYLDTGGRYNPATDTWTPTSTTNAPLGRRRHTAIWTGSLMVVWGGDNYTYYNTGGRYDPTNNTWTPTSTNAPSARTGHTAVWTGTYMIVWGGLYSNPGTNLGTGGQYDPAADTWQSYTSLTNAPFARDGHTGIWTGTYMIVWGGEKDGVYMNTGGRYEPALFRWTPTGSSPEARRMHTAVWTGTLMIVWGGTAIVAPLNTGGRYDPAVDTWTATSTTNAARARYDHTAVWTGNRMIVRGGQPSGSGGPDGGLYDPIADTWAPMSEVNAPVLGAAVWTGSEMLVWGYGSGGRYDPGTDTWTSISSTNAPGAGLGLTGHTAVWTGSRMIVWGGRSGSAFGYTTGGRYDPSTDTWAPTSTTNAPAARAGHTAVWTGSRMIVWGGQYSSIYFSTGGLYDPVTDTWTSTSTLNAPTARSSHTAVWTGNRMVVWGGVVGSGATGIQNTGAVYNPVTDVWTPTSTVGAPSAREFHTAVWIGGRMIVWGGYRFGSSSEEVFGSGGRYIPTDADGDGFDECSGDCDITNPTIYPGAPQLCDGINNDCTSPNWPSTAGTNETDNDGDSFSTCAGDCDDTQTAVWPGAPQVCGDGLNNDCLDPTWPTNNNDQDADGDGYRTCATVQKPADCHDASASVWLPPSEVIQIDVFSESEMWVEVGPAAPGTSSLLYYDWLRTPFPDNFAGLGSRCLDTAGTFGDYVLDYDTPGPNQAFFYLARAWNSCPNGVGPLGPDSAGNPRTGRSCP